MAIESPITRADNWFQGERKDLRFPTTESNGVTPVDLSLIAPGALVWRLLARQGSSLVYIEKTNDVDGGITIAGDDNEIAVVAIEVEDYEIDGVPIPARTHFHDLWDRGNDVQLSYGPALLQRATPAEPA